MFNGLRQADYSVTKAPLKGYPFGNPGARVVLSYDFVSPYVCGGVIIRGSMNPYDPVTASALVPNDPNWTSPTTYEWTFNGQLIPETDASVTRTGGPGETLSFELRMRDAGGRAVYTVTSGQIHNYGTCDPSVMVCNDQ